MFSTIFSNKITNYKFASGRNIPQGGSNKYNTKPKIYLNENSEGIFFWYQYNKIPKPSKFITYMFSIKNDSEIFDTKFPDRLPKVIKIN
ncbi:MAG: hypothetical protein U0354_02375 [Candidatus Sericytochromatia bacterium]